MGTHMAAMPNDFGGVIMEINSPTGLGRCCGRAWLLPDRQLLLIFKLWFNDVI